MSVRRPPSPTAGALDRWAQRLVNYMLSVADKLRYKIAGDNPSEDGILLWDEVNGYPVVSKGGVFRQIVLKDGEAALGVSTTQTAASADTAYALTYAGTSDDSISLSGSQITFEEGGSYLVSFSAQITSSSSSTVDFYFWPRVNGVDITGSTMKNSLHQSSSNLVVSRAAIISVSAGDYLEAMWATSSTSGSLTANAATAFCPATPASTLAITRISG